MNPARSRRGSIAAAILACCGLSGVASAEPVPLEVFITVDTLGNGTLSGPDGTFTMPSSTPADPGPGGLSSVLTYALLNPPSLVFGDVQLVGLSGVSELIRFNAAGRGNANYAASLLVYSSPTDGVDHRVMTPTPPSTFYPNVTSSPVGTVYTPGPGQPGFVSSIITHYTFLVQPACSYTLSPSSVNVPAAGGHGSFTVTPGPGCPIAPVATSNFVSFSVDGSTVDYSVGPNPTLKIRTGTILLGTQPFTVVQAGGNLTFQPKRLSFISNSVTPSTQKVSITGLDGASFSVSSDSQWATVTPSSGTLPTSLSVTVNASGLSQGVHYATLSLIIGGTLVTYSLDYFVQGLPSVVPIPSELTFNYSTGGVLPPAQSLEIYSTSPIAFQAVGTGFVSVTPASGTTTQTVMVSVDPSKLAGGQHSGSVTVTASGVTNSPLVIPITLNVRFSGAQFTSANVVNAASFEAESISPGSLITIFGTDFTNGAQSATRPLFQPVDGASMTIGGVPAPLLFVSSQQVNAQVPFEVPMGPQALILTVDGASTKVQVNVAPASPGIFGAIQNQDSSVNTPQNPAVVGSALQVFFTGQGLVTPAVPTGAAAPLTTLSNTNAMTTATIGTAPAQVVFSGLAPGMIGIGQVNVLVPNLASNDYTLLLKVNGTPSNGVTVSVKTP